MPERPNVLLFFTDQHRLSALGCYGDTVCQTPNIDRLAAEGVRFERAYTVCPVCSPTRGTIMTGQYPHTHGITSNVHNIGSSVHELRDRPELLSHRLGEAGYRCGYTGKWHLGTSAREAWGSANEPSLPGGVGFEGQEFPGHGSGGFKYPEYREWLSERGFAHEVLPWKEVTEEVVPCGELAGPVESTVPYFLADNTISLADRFAEAGEPWFIWHNNWGPHGPYYAPTEYVDMYRDLAIEPWANFDWPARRVQGPHLTKLHPRAELLDWSHWQVALRRYYAFTTLIDHQIGRVVEHLERTGQLDNTVIIFTSDHGETCGSHGGLTDKGWHHFEETHRIGMIVRRPGDPNAGQVRDEFASNADIYPTICELAGAEYDATAMHGASLLPVVAGDATGWRDDVLTEFGGVNGLAMTQRTIRCGDLKYGYNCCCEDELYDLARDPHEIRNLINEPDYFSAAQDLRHRLLDWMGRTGDPARGIYRQSKVYYYDRRA